MSVARVAPRRVGATVLVRSVARCTRSLASYYLLNYRRSDTRTVFRTVLATMLLLLQIGHSCVRVRAGASDIGC